MRNHRGSVRPRGGRWLVLLAGGVLACADSPAQPDALFVAGAQPTVLVENPLCEGNSCRAVQIRAFIPKFTVPGQLPTGARVLGQVPGRRACLVFPEMWQLNVTEVDQQGIPRQSTTFRWTPTDFVSLTVVDGANSLIAASTTFTPATREGWHLTVTGEPGDYRTSVAPAAACDPS